MLTIAVEDEYAKNKDLKKSDVLSIQEWMEKQPHLPKISELEIILFLHSCYYSQEQTKHTIETYYTCRTHAPEFFENLNPYDPQIEQDMDLMVYHPLPDVTDEGYKIIFIKILIPDATTFNFCNQVRLFNMCTDLWLLSEGTANGHMLLVDMSNLTPGFLLKFNPVALKKFFFYLNDAIPFRLKGMQFFNCYSIIDKFLQIIKPAMKKELADLVGAHSKENVKELYKMVPQKLFPEDYGGQAPSINKLQEMMTDRLKNNVELLKQIEVTKRVNEAKRLEKTRNGTNVWGMEGSFKKLDID